MKYFWPPKALCFFLLKTTHLLAMLSCQHVILLPLLHSSPMLDQGAEPIRRNQSLGSLLCQLCGKPLRWSTGLATRFSKWSGIDSEQDHFSLGFALITTHIFWRGSLTCHRRRKQAKFFSLKVAGMSEGTFAVEAISFHFARVWQSAYSTSQGWLPSGAAATPML